MTYIADQIKNENVTYLPTILDYVEMITQITINRDKEITKFFIEENSKYVPKWKQNVYAETNSTGTQTYVPLIVLLEILKREKISNDHKTRK